MINQTKEQTREALLSSERLSEMALASGHLGSWQLNVETQVAVRTLRHDQIFGYETPPEKWTYDTFLAQVLPQDRHHVDTAYRQALEAGHDWEFDARILRLDGEERWIWAKGRHFRDDGGKPVQIIGLVGDITERKHAELALRESEKLAAVGRLASTIAHEINNPLEAVSNLLYLCRLSESVADIHTYLLTAETELQRVAAITAQTLRFHKESPIALPAAWSDLLPSVLRIFQGRLTNHKINVKQQLGFHGTFLCFPGEIRQVLNNLVGNTIDAMPDGGLLILRTRAASHPRSGQKGTVITVADTGRGMDPATLRRIFQPFFSTKGSGGNGLGLWVSQEIITRHHGSLRVRSSQRERCRGTVFSLFLPLDANPDTHTT